MTSEGVEKPAPAIPNKKLLSFALLEVEVPSSVSSNTSRIENHEARYVDSGEEYTRGVRRRAMNETWNQYTHLSRLATLEKKKQVRSSYISP